MFALRHPKIQHLAGDNVDNKPGLGGGVGGGVGGLLVPTPSYPGLAFACCAASLPLLQMRDTDVARLVYSLLQVALPQLLEPQSCSSREDEGDPAPCDPVPPHLLSEVESGRFQHLFNRVEQVRDAVVAAAAAAAVYYSLWLLYRCCRCSTITSISWASSHRCIRTMKTPPHPPPPQHHHHHLQQHWNRARSIYCFCRQ